MKKKKLERLVDKEFKKREKCMRYFDIPKRIPKMRHYSIEWR